MSLPPSVVLRLSYQCSTKDRSRCSSCLNCSAVGAVKRRGSREGRFVAAGVAAALDLTKTSPHAR